MLEMNHICCFTPSNHINAVIGLNHLGNHPENEMFYGAIFLVAFALPGQTVTRCNLANSDCLTL